MTVKVLEVMGGSTGGIGRHVAALASGLDSPGLTVDIAAPPGMSVPMPKPVRRLKIPRRPGLGAVAAARGLSRIIRTEGYGVIHCHGLRASLIGLQGSAGRPVIATLHNLIRPEISGNLASVVFRRGEVAVVRRAARVFAVSEEMAAVLRRHTRTPEKVEVLPIGVERPVATRDRADVRAELGAVDRPVIVTAARLVRQKALDVLLRAVAEIDDPVLVILGDGYLRRELSALAASLGISDRVRFLGWRESVADYLLAADVFALSSTWEARALAAQEAILAGIPVVSTDVGGMPELIEDGLSGRLVPSGDHGALASALKAVLSEPETAAHYAARARERLESAYSDTAMLERVRVEYVRWADA